MSRDDALAALAATPRLLVALDFDGTLAPLVDEPMTARMSASARAALDALVAAPATAVALVSGRALHDLRVIAEHDDGSPFLLAGSHGAEYWLPGTGLDEVDHDPASLELRDELRRRAAEAIANVPGAWIEPKMFGFCVHTRLAESAPAAQAHGTVDELMAVRAPHWRRREGHDIVEYAFRAEGKDTAIAHLRRLTDATAVLFAGDDITDEDALASLGAQDLGVRVGTGPTVAQLRVADISALAALLTRLAHLRTAGRE